ncbi:hypothetical protein BD626DRAFT_556986 [Schizophyllum amplum]|uniref:CNH domain-containing protein n=1 Tax=Schizophyllum amplum TaxID=97359 RepID=A0A550CHS2_9AGAR|nr:hypothetical protein BD626DRAFT_556986 [Auriculariopsis ampla]
MSFFNVPIPIVSGFKERIECATAQGDRLYLGTSTGNLYVYAIDYDPGEGQQVASEVDCKKGISRRAIEQVAFIKDVNSLAILSDSSVTLLPLPSLSSPTPLAKAKGALSFAVDTSIRHLQPDGRPADMDAGKSQNIIPTLVTQLVIGCRRRVVIYSWKDGDAQDPKELALPHSPRAMAFLNPDVVCFGYSPTEYAVFNIPAMSAVDIATPPPPQPTSTAAMGVGAFTGLSGYMALALGARQKPEVLQVDDNEGLITKDTEGIFVGPEGKVSRPSSIQWPTAPEEIAYVKPYLFCAFPAGTIPERTSSNGTQQFHTTSVLQLYSSLSLQPVQTLPYPFVQDTRSQLQPATSASANATAVNASIRLLSAQPKAKSPLLVLTTPTDKATVASEGSTIWQISMKTWVQQLDELMQAGEYGNALALLETLDEGVLPDKDQRRTLIKALNAVSQLRAGQYDDAIVAFLSLDVNPAKVIAMYPPSISGRLAVPQEEWISLFGGPDGSAGGETKSTGSGQETKSTGSGSAPTVSEGATTTTVPPTSSTESLAQQVEKAPMTHARKASLATESRFESVRRRLRPASIIGSDDDDTASIRSQKRAQPDDTRRSVDALMRYLSDRRAKAAAALHALHIDSQQESISPLSEASLDEIFALPNAPLSALTPEQLVRFAQVVDTGLFKSYLLIQPALLRPLCSRPNWCEVSEVEEELRARKKFVELRSLYYGKRMHGKALELLRQLGEEEDDMETKLMPSVDYLQRLGPEYLSLIFQFSRWVFEQDREIAFQIFTSEEVELPRQAVADFLHSIGPEVCARYIEYIIDERGEESPLFHDRLAELYLQLTLGARRRNDEPASADAYGKLLTFLDTTQNYRVDRIYSLLSPHELFEARAILLGRLGRHDQALELYVYRLQDYIKAEEYCKRLYATSPAASGIFLTLLRIYLRPRDPADPHLLAPALDLVGRHGPRLDPLAALDLLPPLVTAQDIRAFLIDALRAPLFDSHVVRHIHKARNEQVTRKLMALQSRRVRITDTRTCPNCHKRLGNTVIAVHSPRGEVTHYHCREAFSKKLREMRPTT